MTGLAEVLFEHRPDPEYEDSCICETEVSGREDGRHYPQHLDAVARAWFAEWLTSDGAVEVMRSAFRGDDYEENAMGAAQEGEWSWFGWLATQQLAALAELATGGTDD